MKGSVFSLLVSVLPLGGCEKKTQHEYVLESLRTTFPGHGVVLSTMSESRSVDAALWDDDKLKNTLASMHWSPDTRRWWVKADGKAIREGVVDNPNLGWANMALYASWRVSREPVRAKPGFTHSGCDIIGKSDGGKVDDACGTRAAGCCNAHDDCYRDNGCTYLSWSDNPSPACSSCNTMVKACFMTGEGTKPCSEATGYCCGSPPPNANVDGETACQNTMWLGGADPILSRNECPSFFYSTSVLTTDF